MKIIREYSYQEQIDDLAEATGLAKHVVKRFLQYQRRFAQDKLNLGQAYTLKGVVQIEPRTKGEEIVLSAKVAQSVKRPVIIKYLSGVSIEEEIENKTITDDELE